MGVNRVNKACGSNLCSPFRWVAPDLPKAREEWSHRGRASSENFIHERMESPKHGFKSTATWLMPLPEQLFRFFDFGEILPRIEIDEHWREHL